MAKKQFQARRVCVTIFEKGWEPRAIPWEGRRVRFIIANPEKCPTTGRRHWQVYAQLLFTATSRKAVRTALNFDSGRIFIAKGSALQNIEYCSKSETREGDTFRWGTASHAGPTGKGSQRNDLAEIKAKIDAGASQAEIMADHFPTWVRYHKSLELYAYRTNKPPNWRQVKVTVIHGETGAGKSRAAIAMAEAAGEGYPASPVINASGQCWWPDYEPGGRAILINEFYGQLRVSYMQQLLDGHRLTVETKNGQVKAAWTHVYITSNFHPRTWWRSYANVPIKVEKSLIRRCRRVIHLNAPPRPEFQWTSEEMTFDPATGKLLPYKPESTLSKANKIKQGVGVIGDPTPFIPSRLPGINGYFEIPKTKILKLGQLNFSTDRGDRGPPKS